MSRFWTAKPYLWTGGSDTGGRQVHDRTTWWRRFSSLHLCLRLGCRDAFDRQVYRRRKTWRNCSRRGVVVVHRPEAAKRFWIELAHKVTVLPTAVRLWLKKATWSDPTNMDVTKKINWHVKLSLCLPRRQAGEASLILNLLSGQPQVKANVPPGKESPANISYENGWAPETV